MLWFWRFVFYSFVGFLLEITFARATRHPKQDRKCFLLLPLCPVYGFGALLILALTARWGTGPLSVMLIGFLSATFAEYLCSLFYERVLGVCFWDYSNVPFNVNGRVCLLFSLAWTVLALAQVYLLAPAADRFLTRIPPSLGPPAMILLLCDGFISALALKKAGSTDVLRWYRT